MFEGQPQAEIEAVFQANPEFRRLYHHHKELDKKVLDDLPTSTKNAKDALQFNTAFWADQGEALEKRFAAWATQ